jgi:hypothetical protein
MTNDWDLTEDTMQAIVVPCTVVEALCKTLVESESCKIPKV